MIENERAKRSLARTVSETDAKVLIRGIREEQGQRKNGLPITVPVMKGAPGGTLKGSLKAIP
jgi:hypothetical protein